MHENAAATGPRLADVSAEIAAAGSSAHAKAEVLREVPQDVPRQLRANNLGLIGVTLTCDFSGRQMDLPVSLELYEDLDAEALQNYLADAARRQGVCEPIARTHRLFALPDSY